MLPPANSRTLSFVYIVGLQSCMDKPCANGTCTDIKKGGVKCDCLPGFAGDYCTRKWISLLLQCTYVAPQHQMSNK